MNILEELAKVTQEASEQAKIDATLRFLRERALQGNLTLGMLCEILTSQDWLGSELMEWQAGMVFSSRPLASPSSEITIHYPRSASITEPVLVPCLKQLFTAGFCRRPQGHEGDCAES